MKIKDYKAEARKLLLGNYGILIASQFIIYMLTYGMTFAAALMVGGSTALAISGNVAATSAAAVITAAVIAAVLEHGVGLFSQTPLGQGNIQGIHHCTRSPFSN